MISFVPNAIETQKALNEILYETIKNGSGANISLESLNIARRVLEYHLERLLEE